MIRNSLQIKKHLKHHTKFWLISVAEYMCLRNIQNDILTMFPCNLPQRDFHIIVVAPAHLSARWANIIVDTLTLCYITHHSIIVTILHLLKVSSILIIISINNNQHRHLLRRNAKRDRTKIDFLVSLNARQDKEYTCNQILIWDTYICFSVFSTLGSALHLSLWSESSLKTWLLLLCNAHHHCSADGCGKLFCWFFQSLTTWGQPPDWGKTISILPHVC